MSLAVRGVPPVAGTSRRKHVPESQKHKYYAASVPKVLIYDI